MKLNSTTHPQLSGARVLLEHCRRLYERAQPDGRGGAVPHPGDLLYWIGCVGAVSLLLFVATR